MKDADKRDELVKKLNEHHCPVCRDCHILEAVDDYVLAREQRLKEEYEKRLQDIMDDEAVWLDKLAIAQEKAYNLEQTIADMVGILKAYLKTTDRDECLEHTQACEAIEEAIRRGRITTN
jgi:hypothetical protein